MIFQTDDLFMYVSNPWDFGLWDDQVQLEMKRVK